MADSRARGSSFSHDPMATASCWITVSELLKERKRHPLFNSWVVLVQVVINVSAENLFERLLYNTLTIKSKKC